MSRRQPAKEGLLFDLPLDRRPAKRRSVLEPTPARAKSGAHDLEPIEAEPVEQPALPLAEAPVVEVSEAREEEAFVIRPAEETAEPEPATRHRRWVRKASPRAMLQQRALAGLIDLGVCAGVLLLLLVALLAQGIRPVPADWPAAALFLLAFSFLYSVLPLAFWGRTPGMTLARLKSTSPEGRPMTFRQAVLKWLGSSLTVALAGLPLLLALGGRRSLSDRLAGAVTRSSETPR